MTTLRLLALLLASSCLSIASCLSAQTPQRYDVFYLSVGSTHYFNPSPQAAANGLQGFPRVRGANKSATQVAVFLEEAGSPFGITITSGPTQLVTRSDISRGLDSLFAAVARSQAQNPLLFIYITGHGVSEGLGWNHFTIPGDFTFSGDIRRVPVKELGRRTIYAADVVDALEARNYPFVLVLDNCQEGEEERFEGPVLSPTAADNANDVLKVVRYLNEFHGQNPVLFSVEPGGKPAYEVRDPLDSQSGISVSPLARRLMMIYSTALAQRRSVTLSQLVARLTSSTFDPVTRPAVTKVELQSNDGTLVPSTPTKRGRHLRLNGSGTTPSSRSAPGSRDFALPARLIYAGTARLDVTSQPGDYIGQGQTIRLSTRASQTRVVREPNGLTTIQLSPGSGETWEVKVLGPQGKPLQRGVYRNATRFSQENRDQPALDISADTRACNEPQGSFEVTDVSYDSSGRVVRLALRFQQSCSDRPGLTGTLQFSQGAPGQ